MAMIDEVRQQAMLIDNTAVGTWKVGLTRSANFCHALSASWAAVRLSPVYRTTLR